MLDKESLYKELCLRKNSNYLKESFFKKKYPKIYQDLLSYNFPKEFKFIQKLYHYLKDDLEFKFGLCIECNNRCSFLTFKNGYRMFCSKKCMTNSNIVRDKRKETNLNRYGVEYAQQSDEIKEKIKQTNLKHFGVTCSFSNKNVQNKIKQTNLKKYGVEYVFQNKEIREKSKKTNLKRYGVENPIQNKEIREKSKKTNLKRYGVEHPMQNIEIQNKTKETNLRRYGVEKPLQNKNILNKLKQANLKKYGNVCSLHDKNISDKVKQTNLEKYGVEQVLKSPEIKNKIIQTNIKKYGTKYAAQSKEVRDKICKTNLERYGVKNTWNLPINYNHRSAGEIKLYDYIFSIYSGKILKSDSVTLKGKEIDIYLPELKLGIEYNGDYWHMNPSLYKFNDYNKRKRLYAYEIWEFDRQKHELAKTIGIELITVWEHDWYNNQKEVKDFIKNKILVEYNLFKEKTACIVH